MIKQTVLFAVFILLAYSSQVGDQMECFRMKDSSYGHFASCTATKPMPLKVETTFTLDKDFTWGLFAWDVTLYDGIEKKTTSLAKCIQGSPGVGNKTAGSNLTLATTCNVLPRQLRQFDMIRYEIHFPNTQWLVWAVPIPGYTTSEDVAKFMTQEEFYQPTIVSTQGKVYEDKKSTQMKSFMSKIKQLKNIRLNA